MRSGLEGVSTKCSSSDVVVLVAYGELPRYKLESGRDDFCDGKGGFARGTWIIGCYVWDPYIRRMRTLENERI